MPSGENFLHYGAVRIRAVGRGNLRTKFIGYDEIETEVLAPLPMGATSWRNIQTLANFQGQAGRLRVEVTKLNETFRINHIIIFVKPMWTDYPSELDLMEQPEEQENGPEQN